MIEGQLEGTENFLALDEDLDKSRGNLVDFFVGRKAELGAVLDFKIFFEKFDGRLAKAFSKNNIDVVYLIHGDGGRIN